MGVLLLLGAGCATRGSVRQVQGDLTTLRGEVSASRRLQEDAARDAARTREEVQALEGRLRGLMADVSAARDELGRLRARIEAAEGEIGRLKTEMTARPAPAAVPPPAPPPPPAPAREHAARPGAPEAAYNAALTVFRAREHGQAVLEFLDFIARYPKHPLAASAQYWIGEAYYLQRDWRQALVEFQKVLEYRGADGKAADALLKIGLCYTNLHEPLRARQAWQRVVQEYPTSEAADRARALLRPRRATIRR
jgi:tol-pal system protein YbgF